MFAENITIEAMTIADYDEVMQLWLSTAELGVNPDFDSRERMTYYLERNSGLSSVARIDGKIIGAVLCGHDARRGSIYHMCVAQDYRGNGLGRKLADRCLECLRALGINTAFLFVRDQNEGAAIFWKSTGWEATDSIRCYFRSF